MEPPRHDERDTHESSERPSDARAPVGELTARELDEQRRLVRESLLRAA